MYNLDFEAEVKALKLKLIDAEATINHQNAQVDSYYVWQRFSKWGSRPTGGSRAMAGGTRKYSKIFKTEKMLTRNLI